MGGIDFRRDCCISRMKLTALLFTLALIATSLPASADFQSAANAYRARHYDDAYRQFLALAKTGNPRAQTVIALMNKYGEAVPKDLHKAFTWYMKAAKQDYGPALYEVGVMYAKGRGVKQDTSRAIDWLKRAARAGFRRAPAELSKLGVVPASPRGSDADGAKLNKAWNFRLPNDIRYARTPLTELPPDASYRVELGLMDTRNNAGRLWDAIVQQAPDVMKDSEPIITLAKGSDQRRYRVQTGPFDDLSSARDFCRRLLREVRTICQPIPQ